MKDGKNLVNAKKNVSRRDFLRIIGLLGLDIFLGAVVGWNYIDKIEPDRVEITNVGLSLPRLPKIFSGFRLVQVSDIHAGYWMTPERFASIVEMVKEQSPDMVAITGDIILAYRGMPNDRSVMDRYNHIFKNLTNAYPAVAVLGNHDHRYGAASMTGYLERNGVKVLANSILTLERAGEKFHIAGVDDVSKKQHDLDAVLAALPEEEGNILLVHEPDFADVTAATGRFDLQISGHSHGGQVVLPGIGPLVLPYLGEKYPSGMYTLGDMYLYTNRGVGMTMPTVRFNCRPEITVFTLESM